MDSGNNIITTGPKLPPSGITTPFMNYDFSRIKVKPVQYFIVFYEYFLYNLNIIVDIIGAVINTIKETYFTKQKINGENLSFFDRLEGNFSTVDEFNITDLFIVSLTTVLLYIAMLKSVGDLIYLKKRYGYDPTKFPISRLLLYILFPFARTKKQTDMKNGHGVHIYIQNFATYQPVSPACTVSIGSLLRFARETIPSFSSDALNFLRRISMNTGLGPATYVSEECRKGEYNFNGALSESGKVLTTVVEEVLKKAKVDPNDIDFVVTTSSLFNPTPSLSALIVNKFKMRKDVKTTSLGGMGCSGSMIAIDCAKDALSAMVIENNMKTYKWCKNTSNNAIKNPLKKRPFYALVVCTENITMNWYRGSNKSMLIPNSLFRLGGAAILLSTEMNKDTKYRLCRVIRTHHGSIERSYNAVVQTVDDQKLLGVFLTKDVPKAGGEVVSDNIMTLYNRILPLSEKLKFVWYNIILRKLVYNIRDSLYVNKQRKALKKKGIISIGDKTVPPTTEVVFKDKDSKTEDMDKEKNEDNKTKNDNHVEDENVIKHLPKPMKYVPDITKRISHFCFHTGGRAVLDNMCTTLHLTEKKLAASRATLYRYGNTSSSSVWYELAYHESTKALQTGEWVWQIAFGSGFKCASCIWEVLPGAIKNPTLFDRYQPNFTYVKENARPCYITKEEQEMDYDEFVRTESKKYRKIHLNEVLHEWVPEIMELFHIKKEELDTILKDVENESKEIQIEIKKRNEEHSLQEIEELRSQKLLFSELVNKDVDNEGEDYAINSCSTEQVASN